jgi:hypothetical protein
MGKLNLVCVDSCWIHLQCEVFGVIKKEYLDEFVDSFTLEVANLFFILAIDFSALENGLRLLRVI